MGYLRILQPNEKKTAVFMKNELSDTAMLLENLMYTKYCVRSEPNLLKRQAVERHVEILEKAWKYLVREGEYNCRKEVLL